MIKTNYITCKQTKVVQMIDFSYAQTYDVVLPKKELILHNDWYVCAIKEDCPPELDFESFWAERVVEIFKDKGIFEVAIFFTLS